MAIHGANENVNVKQFMPATKNIIYLVANNNMNFQWLLKTKLAIHMRHILQSTLPKA